MIIKFPFWILVSVRKQNTSCELLHFLNIGFCQKAEYWVWVVALSEYWFLSERRILGVSCCTFWILVSVKRQNTACELLHFLNIGFCQKAEYLLWAVGLSEYWFLSESRILRVSRCTFWILVSVRKQNTACELLHFLNIGFYQKAEYCVWVVALSEYWFLSESRILRVSCCTLWILVSVRKQNTACELLHFLNIGFYQKAEYCVWVVALSEYWFLSESRILRVSCCTFWILVSVRKKNTGCELLHFLNIGFCQKAEYCVWVVALSEYWCLSESRILRVSCCTFWILVSIRKQNTACELLHFLNIGFCQKAEYCVWVVALSEYWFLSESRILRVSCCTFWMLVSVRKQNTACELLHFLNIGFCQKEEYWVWVVALSEYWFLSESRILRVSCCTFWILVSVRKKNTGCELLHFLNIGFCQKAEFCVWVVALSEYWFLSERRILGVSCCTFWILVSVRKQNTACELLHFLNIGFCQKEEYWVWVVALSEYWFLSERRILGVSCCTFWILVSIRKQNTACELLHFLNIGFCQKEEYWVWVVALSEYWFLSESRILRVSCSTFWILVSVRKKNTGCELLHFLNIGFCQKEEYWVWVVALSEYWFLSERRIPRVSCTFLWSVCSCNIAGLSILEGFVFQVIYTPGLTGNQKVI